MRLADFILSNREPILSEWEAFARTCVPASGTMDVAALRDHADQMLTVIAADLQTSQSRERQSEKSKGGAPRPVPGGATAAEAHGAGRADSGFSVEQMVAEYRALRASVIRLWTEAKGQLGPADVEDLIRFNESIDQSLAESVSRYREELEKSKEMFLAILGHDLRTPLGAISTSADFLLDRDELEGPTRTLTERIASSATRTLRMVGDLLDFTRGRVGGGIPIRRAGADMGRVIDEAVDEIRAALPDARIEVETRGELRGEWDRARIGQAFTNLIGNAVQHGTGRTVAVEVNGGEEDAISVVVHNEGEPISPKDLDGLFNPLKPRSVTSTVGGPTGSLGLGLYITHQIVTAHGGTIRVDSSDATGTTFAVHLPRSGDDRR